MRGRGIGQHAILTRAVSSRTSIVGHSQNTATRSTVRPNSLARWRSAKAMTLSALLSTLDGC
jgi:hypothetical protein